MKYIRILLLIVFTLCFSTMILAKEVIIERAKGKVKIVDGDERKAREEARTEALIDAVRQATGVIISVETTATNFTEVEEIIKSKTNGKVVSFDPIMDEIIEGTYVFVAKVIIDVPDKEKLNKEIDENDIFFQISDGILYKYDGNNTIVKIPDSVVKIDKGVFANNTNIRKVILPKNIKYLGDEAFKNCQNLRYINLEDSISYIGESCFENCVSLTEAIIPKGVKIIEEYSFLYCYNLEKIEIPNGVVEIKDCAFCCAYFDESTKTIQKNIKVKNLIIPETVKKIGKWAFFICANLEELIIEDGVENIGEYAFYSCGIKKLEIPDSVKEIGYYAFSSCKGLEELKIGVGVEKIGKSAFSICSNIKKLVIPGSVKEIGESAFLCIFNLEELIIGDGVEKIDVRAFSNGRIISNNSLKILTIPKSVELIGAEAFKNYKELKDVYLYKSAKKEKDSFDKRVKFHYLD